MKITFNRKDNGGVYYGKDIWQSGFIAGGALHLVICQNIINMDNGIVYNKDSCFKVDRFVDIEIIASDI